MEETARGGRQPRSQTETQAGEETVLRPRGGRPASSRHGPACEGSVGDWEALLANSEASPTRRRALSGDGSTVVMGTNVSAFSAAVQTTGQSP